MEAIWSNATGRNCKLIRESTKRRDMHAALAYSAQAHGNSSEPVLEVKSALSAMKWDDGCVEYIEPLTGAARHPFAVHNGCCLRSTTKVREVNIYNLSYLLPHNGCAGECASRRRPRHRRALLFDLGCSKWQDRGLTISGGFGSSLPLFRRLYERNCIAFDHMWGWEARPHNQAKWWSTVPTQYHDRLTFINRPVTAGGGGETDALATLAAVARPSDFVVVKIDIDSPTLELELVRRIAQSDELSALVDELFFEYHIRVEDATPACFARKAGFETHEATDTVDQALALMQLLRTRGVRSHFWV